MTRTSAAAFSGGPASSALTNDDLAPVPAARRTWSTWSSAALWVGMAICITTYTLASSLIKEGMSWKQAVMTIFLSNLIVLIPMTLNAHPGTAYGIPFPVLIRSSFGTLGANIPALLRALVACGWFGIQTWIGGAAIYTMAAIIFGFDSAQKTPLPVIGISAGEFLCFLIFWAINIVRPDRRDHDRRLFCSSQKAARRGRSLSPGWPLSLQRRLQRRGDRRAGPERAA